MSDSNGILTRPRASVEAMLFESLVHHLIEKGVLTKNDALSVVQTVASVKRGQLEEGREDRVSSKQELAMLLGLFDSLKALRVPGARIDGHNVHQLRPPLHGDQVEFPSED